MANYHLRPAKRSSAKLLAGIYAESGCGKTVTALLLARGFVGPAGKICMIETESGRGEIYTGVKIPASKNFNQEQDIGDYQVIPIVGDYSPTEYGKAISAAEAAGVDALIIDSASHEWEGVGGVLDMAAKNQEAGRKGPLVWQKPKIDHSREFVLRLMGTPIPIVIVCMRAKYPMEEKSKPGGGKEWTRSEILEPKQSEDILYEMLLHGWIGKDHSFHPTKFPEGLPADLLPNGSPINIEHGKRLLDWLNSLGPSSRPPIVDAGSKQDDEGLPGAVQELITVDQATVLGDRMSELRIPKPALLAAASKSLGVEIKNLESLPAGFYKRAEAWVEAHASK